MKYVIYDKTNNDVIGYGEAPFEEDINLLDNEINGVLIVNEFPENPARVVNGIVVGKTASEIEAIAFQEAIREAPNLANAKIASARRAYITQLPGQDAIYQAKEAEAVAYLADPSPDMADYPLLNAETGITAATTTDLANLWITMGTQWRSIAAQIEAARMTANAAIGNAATVADIEAALTALDTTLAGLPPP